MSAFALFAFLCGAVLAFRFKVFVLYPITGLGAIAALALGTAAGIGVGAILLGIIACGIALQIGYLFGGLVRGTMIMARLAARRRHVGPAPRNPQII